MTPLIALKRWINNDFNGRIIKGTSSCYYLSEYRGSQFCQDFIGTFHPNRDTHIREVPAWGYEGNGPDRLAIGMIVLSLAPFSLVGGGNTVYRVSQVERFEIQAVVDRLYKKFAKEVVANLPDKWTLSRRQIRKWIKKNL